MKFNKNYIIKKIDTHEIEIDLLNCSDVAICLEGFRIGKYDFINNIFTPNDLWHGEIDKTFYKLTKRQQKLILQFANKYFIKIYKNIYFDKLKKGEFFAPTDENKEREFYYTSRIETARKNIEFLEKTGFVRGF